MLTVAETILTIFGDITLFRPIIYHYIAFFWFPYYSRVGCQFVNLLFIQCPVTFGGDVTIQEIRPRWTRHWKWNYCRLSARVWRTVQAELLSSNAHGSLLLPVRPKLNTKCPNSRPKRKNIAYWDAWRIQTRELIANGETISIYSAYFRNYYYYYLISYTRYINHKNNNRN